MRFLFPALASGAFLVAGATLAQEAMSSVAADHGAMAPTMEIMTKSMSDMEAMKSTGRQDADFLLMMLPHHQSAIDMAKVALENGTDPGARRIAGQVIAAQQKEIEEIRGILKGMGVEPPSQS